jgi:outer membrane lipoprotein-sorting protein
MNDLLEQLDTLHGAVPDAPGFADAVIARLPAAPPAASGWRIRVPRRMKVAALAASVALVLLGAVFALMSVSSPQAVFARVVDRVEKAETVRYSERTERTGTQQSSAMTDLRTFATGGRRRSELSSARGPRVVVIHNAQLAPDVDLSLYEESQLAEITPADAGREALSDQNPVRALRKFASDGVKAGPQRQYRGVTVSSYESEKPEPIDGGQQFLTRRVLIDKASGLPVQMEIDYDMTPLGLGTHHVIMDSFEWNPAVDDKLFSPSPPAGYHVRYNLARPLGHGLNAYASQFESRLPDQIDAAALAAMKQRLDLLRSPKNAEAIAGVALDADWGFAVPAFAAKYHLDLRYYGAGKKLDPAAPRQPIAAIEIAPNLGEYDVIMSDRSRARLKAAELPPQKERAP